MSGTRDYRHFRQQWNAAQKELRMILGDEAQHARAVALFLQHHAVLHTAVISQPPAWSYADDLLQGMSEAQMRRMLPGEEHSVAWLLWHMARIEDVVMNLLVAGLPPVLAAENWEQRLKLNISHTGNAMTEAEIAALSQTIDLEVVQAYRLAVGRRTQEIVPQLQPQTLRQKVSPQRINQVLAMGAVTEAAREIADYWRKRTIAGLLLMPPTRHNMVHLNEIERLKRKG